MRQITADDVRCLTAAGRVRIELPGPSGRRPYDLTVDEAYRFANNVAEAAAAAEGGDWPGALDVTGMRFSSQVTADGSVVLVLATTKGPIALRLSGDQLRGLASLPAADAENRPAQGSA